MEYPSPYRPIRFLTLFLIFSALLLLAAMISPVYGQMSRQEDPNVKDSTFKPNVLPKLEVPLISGAVQLDGILDDALWSNAAIATNFVEHNPNEKVRPPIGIKAYIAYDADNVYVAYSITDDPAGIRAHLTDRDDMWQDDYVGLLLDPNGDGQVTYFIASNAFGIQGDTRAANGNEDSSFDLIYESAGQITETGFDVEMVIPFRSLRFPKAEVQNWRATFWITRPREDRSQYSWAYIDRSDPCFTCQWGTLSGMKGIQSGNNLEILPSLTGSQAGGRDFGNPGSGFNNDRITADPSLNIKYGVSSALTLDATINPDFSQIESDEAQIDVNSSFALSFPERRPFFLEGADLFATEIDAVYTRSINDPIAAMKLSGRSGGWTYGYIGGRDNTTPILMPFEEYSRLVSGGKSLSNIVRARRSFTDGSFIAATGTDRRLDNGGSGSLVGVDGALRFRTKYVLSAQVLVSRTEETNDADLSTQYGLDGITFDRGRHTAALDGEVFSGHAFHTEFDRRGRNYGFEFQYEQYSPTFRAANGFVYKNDLRRFQAQNRYTFYTPESSWMNRLTVFAGVQRFWNYDNVLKDDGMYTGFFGNLKRQTRIELVAITSEELFAGQRFTGLNRIRGEVGSNFSERVQMEVEWEYGNAIYRNSTAPSKGRMFEWSYGLGLRATHNMTIRGNLVHAQLWDRATNEDFFSGYIVRSRLDYQWNRKLSTRLIVQYNDFSENLEIDPLITYRVSPFTVFHFGSSHRYEDFPGSVNEQKMLFQQTNRQIFFKLQYLFRL